MIWRSVAVCIARCSEDRQVLGVEQPRLRYVDRVHAVLCCEPSSQRGWKLGINPNVSRARFVWDFAASRHDGRYAATTG